MKHAHPLQEFVEGCGSICLAAESAIGAVPGEPDGAVGNVIWRHNCAVDGHQICHTRSSCSCVLQLFGYSFYFHFLRGIAYVRGPQ